MGLFNSETKEMKKQFNEQMSVQKDSTDNALVQQMNEQANVAYDPQVSAMLLRQGDFFLTWNQNPETGVFTLAKKYDGFVEPGGIEPYSFLNEKKNEGEFLNDGDNVLTSILDYGDKYGIDINVKNSWNKLARKRMRFLGNSRTIEGKAQQLAKSQIIKSSGQMVRYNDPNAKSQKFLGLF